MLCERKGDGREGKERRRGIGEYYDYEIREKGDDVDNRNGIKIDADV